MLRGRAISSEASHPDTLLAVALDYVCWYSFSVAIDVDDSYVWKYHNNATANRVLKKKLEILVRILDRVVWSICC